MLRKSKHVDAVIRKHWREFIRGGTFWIDGYNNAIHRDAITTLKTNTGINNIYFFCDGRQSDSDNKSTPQNKV